MTYQPDYSVSYGSKYEKGLDVKEIAKRVRQDIKKAIKEGTLPHLKASVRIDRFSGGCSLSVTIKEASYPVLRFREPEELVAFEVANAQQYPSHRVTTTEESHAVEAAIAAIVSAYNFDGSDSMVDYFHVNFYGSVSHDWELRDTERKALLAELEAVPEEKTPETAELVQKAHEVADEMFGKEDDTHINFLEAIGCGPLLRPDAEWNF